MKLFTRPHFCREAAATGRDVFNEPPSKDDLAVAAGELEEETSGASSVSP
jgi:hypothetical protein